jgi:hypothetical protein
MTSPRNYKQFYALLDKAGMKEEKAQLCSVYSKGRTARAKELTTSEYSELIGHLQAQANIVATHEVRDRKRKRVIAIMASRGYVSDGKPDMTEIYKWVEDKGCHKPKKLNAYSSEELSDLIYQLEQIRDWYKDNGL